jgi:hypothetical protein
MTTRNISVKVSVSDSSGNTTTKDVVILEDVPNNLVAGGYYLSGNGNMTSDTTGQGMNLKGFTQYRSLADANTFPGYQKDYLKTFVSNGIWANFVLELKHYGAANQNAQTFTVEGKSYTVPAPNMTIQQRSGSTWPKAYGYDQILSGQADGLLHRAAYQLKNMPAGKINVQLASEFDTDHEFGTTEAGVSYTWEQSDARALEAVNYMINYFRTYGIGSNVTFTIGMAGFNRGAFKRMHPESIMPKIGYLQFNCYRRSATQTAYEIFKRTKVWSDADLGPLAKAKDIIVAEWGTPMSLNDQATWIKTVGSAIKQLNTESTTGKFVMTNYFNSNDGWGTLNPKQAGLDALKVIYSADPYA